MSAPGRHYDRLRDTTRRAELIRRALPPEPGSAVEFGPGTGWLISLLLAEGWDVTAYEADPNRAHDLERQYPAAKIEARAVRSVELGPLSEPHDAAFALSVLHHLEDPRTGLYGLLEASPLVVVETPSRAEADNPNIAGGPDLVILEDLVIHNRPEILGWSPSAFQPGALRALCAFDTRLLVGTVTSGAGWSTKQWPDVGQKIAETLREPLVTGTLNLELSRPLYSPGLPVPTRFGDVMVNRVSVAGLEAWALTMPDSDRGPLFTEIAASFPLRQTLGLSDGDRLPVRPRSSL